MSRLSDRWADLLVGERRVVTRRALVLAGGFFVVAALLHHLVHPTHSQNDFLRVFHWVFLLSETNPYAKGAFLVVGLAAIHAYLNQGYLPSLCLGWGPVAGSDSWSFESIDNPIRFYFDPVSGFERTVPEAVVFATLGFAIGLALRWIHHQHYSDTPFSPGVGEESKAE